MAVRTLNINQTRNVMKTNILSVFLLILLFFQACQTSDQKIDLSDGLSIALPENFNIEKSHTAAIDILKAQFESQQIICSFATINGIDTINTEKLNSILKLNTDRYIEPFNEKEVYFIENMVLNESDTVKDGTMKQLFSQRVI